MSINYLNIIKGPVTEPFIIAVNKDINELNALIHQYNQSTDTKTKIKLLQQMFLYKERMDHAYSDRHISYFTDYQDEIQNKLFKSMQAEARACGIRSLHHSEYLVNAPLDSFPIILANMEPEKVNKLLQIFLAAAKYNKQELENLYSPSEQGYQEYQKFINSHSIVFLGGGNSKNFKVIPADGSQAYVLKIDNRLGMPKGLEQHLRKHQLKNVFSPVYVERQASGTDKGVAITRTLLVTKFCDGGDLECHGKQFSGNSFQRLQSAVDIYGQMALILQRFINEKAGFPDMKNTNWLKTLKGKIQLADTKSFIPLDKDGFINFNLLNQNWYQVLQSQYMNPPELNTQCSADKVHSFMLGKNIYQYLTGCNFAYLFGKSDANLYDFSNEIFSSSEGKRFEQLIRSLIQPNPVDRPPMSYALLELGKIKCQLLLKEMTSYNVGNSELINFIREHAVSSNKANSQEEITVLSDSIQQKLIELKKYVFDSEKKKCLAFLGELKSYNLDHKESEKVNFINEQTINVNKANSPEEMTILSKKIQTTVIEGKQYAFDLVKNKCQSHLNELKVYNQNGKNRGLNNYLEQSLKGFALDDTYSKIVDRERGLRYVLHKVKESTANNNYNPSIFQTSLQTFFKEAKPSSESAVKPMDFDNSI